MDGVTGARLSSAEWRVKEFLWANEWLPSPVNRMVWRMSYLWIHRRDVRGNRRWIGGGRRGGRQARKMREVETYVYHPTRGERRELMKQGFRRAVPSVFPWWV